MGSRLSKLRRSPLQRSKKKYVEADKHVVVEPVKTVVEGHMMDLTEQAEKECACALQDMDDSSDLVHEQLVRAICAPLYRNSPYVLKDKAKTPLLSLPHDLLRELSDWLAMHPAALTALRSTCKTLSGVLPQPELDVNEREKLYELDRRDRLERYRALDGVETSERMKCAGCLTTHPAASFTRLQLQHGAVERRCRRAVAEEGRVHLCPHVNLNHRQLRMLRSLFMHDMDDRAGWRAREQACCSVLGADTLNHIVNCADEMSLQQTAWLATIRHGDFVMSNTVLIDWDYSQIKKVRRKEIIARLHENRWSVCPHLQEQFMVLYSWMVTPPRAHASGKPVTEMKCWREGCKAEVQLSEEAGQSYVIYIERTMGKMQDPCDPLWLCQIEKPCYKARA